MKRLTVVFIAVAALGLMTATAAQAVPGQKATGSIRMGQGLTETDPQQAITFDVFETTPVKGNITYTNYGLADAGSGRWRGEYLDLAHAQAGGGHQGRGVARSDLDLDQSTVLRLIEDHRGPAGPSCSEDAR